MNLAKPWIPTLAAAVAVFALVLWYGLREAPLRAPAAATEIVPAIPAPLASAPTAPATATPSAVPAVRTAALIDETHSPDPRTRAAAIQALADAPRAEALPALRTVLVNGDPEERKLALAALRQLAIAQGDEDGKAREAVRYAIYHGDDLMPADALQETLDAIEQAAK